MAKIEDNTKRRSNEMDEQSVTSIPPKKRFLSRASSPDEEDQDDNEDAADTFREPLEAFRKDAILRQWKDYLRSLKRWKKYVEQADLNKQESEDHLRLWEESFNKLQIFLSNIIQDGMSSFGQSSTDTHVNTQEFDNLLSEDWAVDLTPNMLNAFKSNGNKDSTIAKLNQLIESWITKREKITTGFESVFENGSLKEIQRDHDRILASWVNGQRSLQDMRNRYKLSNFKYLFLSEELRILNSRLELTESNLRQAQFDLEKAESNNLVKNEDVKMTDISTATSTTTTTTTATTITTAAAVRASNPALFTPTTEANPPTFNNQQQGISPDPLIHAQQILDEKLHEIEKIKDDRIALKKEIARLEMDLICVPESRIYKAQLCRNLSNQRYSIKDKCNHISDICRDFQNSVDDLTSNRRRLIKDLDSEQVNYFKELESQLRKLDEDLTRIRGDRDELQMKYDEGKAATEVGRASIAELKIIADTRKERVNYLETEVLRLQKKMAARTGVKEYYELLLNSDGREPLLLPLQNELKAVEEQLEQTKARMYQQFPQETLDRELAQISELKQLELEAATFEAKYGFHPSVATNDVQVQKVLQDRIESEKLIISESNEKIENLEKTEKSLLGEIESVAKAYGDLEDENVAKVRELAALEDEILRLQVERVKYSQAFTALNKSKDAHAMVANTLIKQNEKQLAHIRQMTEREKNLSNQLNSLEREYNTSNAVCEVYKQKIEESKLTLDELKQKTNFTKDKISELQKSIFDKIQLIEESAHTRLRSEESSELLKRKVESTNKVEKPAEMKLRKEREEYKSLLNCSNCRDKLKSHIILKCMHTFCKECLDSRRRCPNCDESFSVHDVKQFFY